MIFHTPSSRHPEDQHSGGHQHLQYEKNHDLDFVPWSVGKKKKNKKIGEGEEEKQERKVSKKIRMDVYVLLYMSQITREKY